MNLVWFLSIGTILSIIFGEFGQFPFASPTSVSVTDFLLGFTLIFLLIWQIGIQKKIEITLALRILVLFWIVALISLLLSGQLLGGLYLIRFILYSSSFWLGYLLIKDKQVDTYTISKVIILSGILIAILGFLQLIFMPDFAFLEKFGYDPHIRRLSSTFLDPNYTGAYLNISFILSLYLWLKNKNKSYLIITVFLAASIILTFSRSAYLMFFTQLTVIGILKYRKILLILFLGLIISYLTLPRFAERVQGGIKVDQSASERFKSWEKGLVIFKNNPILGVGFNNLRHAYQKYDLFEKNSSDGGNSGAGVDSSILSVLATTGIIGLIVYISFWLTQVYSFIQNILKNKYMKLNLVALALVFGILVNSQFINSLFYPPIMFILYLFLGIVNGVNLKDNRIKKDKFKQ